MIKEHPLQKNIDYCLSTIRPDEWCFGDAPFNTSIEDACEPLPNEDEIKEMVKKSKEYKNVLSSFNEGIINHCNLLISHLEDFKKDLKLNSVKKSAINKLKKANLTRDEKISLGLQC